MLIGDLLVLMYIHKGSFTEAMRDNPSDPLSSSYSASFLAGYRSASEIIKGDIRNFTNYPMLFIRWYEAILAYTLYLSGTPGGLFGRVVSSPVECVISPLNYTIVFNAAARLVSSSSAKTDSTARLSWGLSPSNIQARRWPRMRSWNY
jgi:hypothetical protein